MLRETPQVPQTLAQHLDRHFAKLSSIGAQPDGSISRIAFGDAESAAMAYVRSEAEAFGCVGRYDGIGNLVVSAPAERRRRVLVGSHLDSVPHGGNYDGAAGVLAGLECLRKLGEESPDLELGVDLVVWRGEEYTFNAVYKGSSAAFGLSETHVLHNRFGDRSLRSAIRSQGFDPSFIDEAKPTFESDYIDSIDGYLELHIEQGVRLEQAEVPLGVVTSIAGDRRFLVTLEGRFDHSGATPMGRRYRADVNLAMAYIQVRIDELAARQREAHPDFVQTVGIINADPEVDTKLPDIHSNSVTKVSGIGYFTLDIMSPDDGFMDEYSAEVHRLVWRTAKEFGVKAVIEQTDSAPGLRELDGRLRGALERACDASQTPYLELPSGAGHDAAMVAQARHSDGSPLAVGMLFVPCRDGISHAKEEHAEVEHVALGARAIADAIRTLDTE